MGRGPRRLHVFRPHGVRPCTEARRHCAGIADHLVDASERAGDQWAVSARYELLGTARLGRGGVAHPAPPVLDRAADEVGSHVDGRARVRRHLADGGGLGSRPGRRTRARRRRRSTADLHRSAVALLRLSARCCGRRGLESDLDDRLRRWERGGHVDGGDPGSVARPPVRPSRPLRSPSLRGEARWCRSSPAPLQAPSPETTSGSSSFDAVGTSAESLTPSR